MFSNYTFFIVWFWSSSQTIFRQEKTADLECIVRLKRITNSIVVLAIRVSGELSSTIIQNWSWWWRYSVHLVTTLVFVIRNIFSMAINGINTSVNHLLMKERQNLINKAARWNLKVVIAVRVFIMFPNYSNGRVLASLRFPKVASYVEITLKLNFLSFHH